VQALYLQYNRIEVIEGLDDLTGLQFLALQHNRLRKVENLKHLKQLQFLDLSSNKISELDEKEIPQSVQILNLKSNPCRVESGYKDRLRAQLPELMMLDGLELEVPEIEDGDSLPLEVNDVNVQRPGSAGLSAYYKKGDMQEALNSSINDVISQYSREVLADVQGFQEQVEGIVSRSMERRREEEAWLHNKRTSAEDLGRSLSAVKEDPGEDMRSP